MPERYLGNRVRVHDILRRSPLRDSSLESSINPGSEDVLSRNVFEEKGSRRLLNRAEAFFEGGSRSSEVDCGVRVASLDGFYNGFYRGRIGSEKSLRRRGRRGRKKDRSCGCLSRGEGRHRCPKVEGDKLVAYFIAIGTHGRLYRN